MQAINTEALFLCSPGLMQECLTFVLNEDGKPEAQPGTHDDRVMAAGIAWQARQTPQSQALYRRPAGM